MEQIIDRALEPFDVGQRLIDRNPSVRLSHLVRGLEMDPQRGDRRPQLM